MEWRREDARYAVATAAAMAFVAYLLAGNFGLLPSPLPGVGAPTGIDRVFPVAANPPTAPPVAGEQVREAGPVIVAPIVRERPVHTPPPVALDRTPPTSEITTPDGSTVVSTPLAPEVVRGVVADAGSGVQSVTVRFSGDVGTTPQVAQLDCAGDRKRCTWTAAIPTAVGTYRVEALATDRDGNTERRGPVITLTVVSAAPDAGTSGGDEPGLVGGLVNTVTGLLGL